jgi:hypothetical protein
MTFVPAGGIGLTEKELKKLNRYQLLELLIIQTERADSLQAQVEELEKS